MNVSIHLCGMRNGDEIAGPGIRQVALFLIRVFDHSLNGY